MNFKEYIFNYEVPAFNFTKTQLEYLYSNGNSPMSPTVRREYEQSAKLSDGRMLIEALEETGYKKTNAKYTKKQVELFFDAVGSPCLTDKNIDYLFDIKVLSFNQVRFLKVLFSQME